MTDLAQLLLERGIRKAVVIDDAYDDVPRPSDLNSEAWSTFFDDLTEQDNAILKERHPQFAESTPDDLQTSPEFVAILWKHRDEISKNAREGLFAEYEQRTTDEREKLDGWVAAIKALNVECAPMGRDVAEETARQADIILVDLFLGFGQTAGDMAQAVDRVRRLVSGRESAPPLVVLMSRSTRLREKRNEFRDSAALLGSAFRVVSKGELEEEGALERILYRLASHYEDAKRVAQFVLAWDSSLEDARKRFIKIIRRLDLADFAQVRALLLEFEGQALGEYLLDVCDGVLRHEIEANTGTIAAARALNQIDLENYPAPHLAGTTDLQELVHRMVFQHPERLRLSQDGADVHLQFGDILRWKNPESGLFQEKVSLVLTPACDLIRAGADGVLLLSGTLLPLEPTKWLYAATGQARTPIIEIPDEGRFWIKWDLKKVQTQSPEEIKAMLGERADLKRIGRLREMYAVEIQQKFLSDFGRIGQPANPPATFAVSLSLFFVDSAGNARTLATGPLENAVCYAGRDAASKPIHRVVLSEQTCDVIAQAVAELNVDDVLQSARASLTALKADKDFFIRLERGKIEMPPDSGGMKSLKGGDNIIYAQVRRNGDWSDRMPITEGNLRRASLLIDVKDITNEAPGAGVGEAGMPAD